MKFTDMGLSESTLEALAKKGFETASPIQASCIPMLLAGTKDIIGQAQTGTGKTAAFAIPVIEKIDPSTRTVQAIVIAPTRELAIQVANEITSLKGTKRISVCQVYGGAPMGKQIRELSAGAQIVVGTPGRMIDMINRGKLRLGDVQFCILDEADEMLNMGFLEEIESILEACNPDRQMLCFSATMPKSVKRVAERYMGEYEFVKAEASQLTTGNTEQLSMHLRQSDKLEALTRVIDSTPDIYAIVFCKTKRGCDELVQQIQSIGYRADALHGDMGQSQREKVLKKFKSKKITLLCATDVAARGIDVDDLTHVVNYDIPHDTEAYTHRIGRTGRAGKKGIALTFVTKKDERKIRNIERATKSTIKKVEVPTIESVIAQKKGHILEKITSNIQAEPSDIYTQMLAKLSEIGTEQEIIGSLLKIAYGKQLNPSAYKDIKHIRTAQARSGNTRLFVAQGRNTGINGPRELVERLQSETKVSQRVMDDVVIRDDFSFVTCPDAEAGIILDVFTARPGRSLVSVSKERNSGGGGGGYRGKRNSGGGGGGYRGKSSNGGSRGGNRSGGGAYYGKKDRGNKGGSRPGNDGEISVGYYGKNKKTKGHRGQRD